MWFRQFADEALDVICIDSPDIESLEQMPPGILNAVNKILLDEKSVDYLFAYAYNVILEACQYTYGVEIEKPTLKNVLDYKRASKLFDDYEKIAKITKHLSVMLN